MNRSYNGAIEQYRYALRFQNNILNNHAELRCISPIGRVVFSRRRRYRSRIARSIQPTYPAAEGKPANNDFSLFAANNLWPSRSLLAQMVYDPL